MQEYIKVRGAREHNLKSIDVDIPKNQFVVITGLSGSGKSSLAFDTIYAEGQRRYIDSLSSYARQFLKSPNRPEVDEISGLSPAISIQQKTTSKNPRSTVGTITEIYDYLRLLYARIGVPYSPMTGLPIKSQTISEMVQIIKAIPDGAKIYILAPIVRGLKGEFRSEILNFKKQGFQRIVIDDIMYDIYDVPAIDKNKKHNLEILVDRVVINENLGNRLAESIETALKLSNGIVYIQIVDLTDIDNELSQYTVNQKIILSERYSCPASGFQIEKIEPRIFSFNNPFGACKTCHGLGREMFFDPNLIVPDSSISINDGALAPWGKSLSKTFKETINAIAKHYKFALNIPFAQIPQNIQDILFYGSGNTQIVFQYYDGINSKTVKQKFAGIIQSLEDKYNKCERIWTKEELNKYRSEGLCNVCNGKRLNLETLCIKIDKLDISEVSDKTISQIKSWLEQLESKLTEKEKIIIERIIKEVMKRLNFLINVGLDYLTLSRKSESLSGGEAQRIRLASQIGSGLTGVLYVLDEPSIGLHQRDNTKLIDTLRQLQALGNTILVVEHDEETINAADYVIDVGPGAGIHGGKVIVSGTPKDVALCEDSITGQYLIGSKSIKIPKKFRTGHENKILELIGATSNNLQNVDIAINLGTFTTVTGVSGSGKSSLIIHTLYKAIAKELDSRSKLHPGKYKSIKGLEHIDKIIDIDQSPIGRTPRSNPATYTGVFMIIRDWFVDLPESQARGYKAGRFSFNVKGGRCEACQGDGLIKIEMHFLPDVYVKCDVCNGMRYNNETLEIKYKGKSIADVLEMTVEDAMIFFDKMPTIYDKLATLNVVGLGYIKIGQSATTLSGGEAQRIKLSKELSKRSTGKTLYILDEPTTGLHVDDINRLLEVLHKLVDMGNTVIVIEHNIDVIKTSDCVIDIGPEGGDKGGRVLQVGTPPEIVRCKESFTGKYLKPYFQ